MAELAVIRVGSYLLLNHTFRWLYSVVLPIVFCAKSIVIFVRFIDLLANPEARSLRRYDTTVIWTHDRDVRGMGLFSILRHKLLL